LDKLVREIGVKGEYQLWYVSPGTELKDGLRVQKTDRDTIRFINEFKSESIVDFYVETISVDCLDDRYDTYVEGVVEVVEDEAQSKQILNMLLKEKMGMLPLLKKKMELIV